MKKIITLGLTAAILISASATTAFAASTWKGTNYANTAGNAVSDYFGRYSNFVDADGDGICDNTGLYIGMGRGKNGGRFIDNDGDGVNDNIGSGIGRYFTDSDGDGICDNIGTGIGPNFEDNDGDGVCDNVGTGANLNQAQGGQGKNAGQGRGRNRS